MFFKIFFSNPQAIFAKFTRIQKIIVSDPQLNEFMALSAAILSREEKNLRIPYDVVLELFSFKNKISCFRRYLEN